MTAESEDACGRYLRRSILVHLLSEVMCLSELLDQPELRLQPIRVVLFGVEDLLEELARAVVAERATQLDRIVQDLDRVFLEREVERELLRHRLTDVHLAELLKIGNAFEEENACDQLVRVLHLVDRLRA